MSGRGLKRLAIALFIALVWLALAGSEARGQQNLFNVPSGEITEPGAFFFQQQFNFTRSGQSNTTIDYGLPGDFEVGLNVFDLPLYFDASTGANANRFSDFLFNAQRGFVLSDSFEVGVGFQLGVGNGLAPPIATSDSKFVQFNWITAQWQAPGHWGKFLFGPYYGNHPFLGQGNTAGFMLGAEIPVIEGRFNFVADYLSGTNDTSVAVVGGVFMFPSDWHVSMGVQLPSPASGNEFGFVLELTKFAWGRSGRKEPASSGGERFSHR